MRICLGEEVLPEFPVMLAPMEDVSDPPFRRICRRLGADMVFTEFISSEGLIRNAAQSARKLDIFEDERPVGIQIFGGEEGPMVEAAAIAEAAGPTVIDINYGCPVFRVVNKGAGAAILQDIDKMERLTRRIVERVRLPVTVKTRLGWDAASIRIVEVARRLQDAGIAMLTVHFRTRKQMYKGRADWTWMRRLKETPGLTLPIIGNGDIDSPEKALEARDNYGADGIMIGRAAIGNPWIFQQIKHFLKTGEHLPPPSVEERVAVCRQHLEASIQWKGERRAVFEMRKHYRNYFRGLPDFKALRIRLVEAPTAEAVMETLDEVLRRYAGYVPAASVPTT